MGNISSYILTIAGVILISVVVELVMSESSIGKYVKSILSFFIIGVIIAPIPSLISSDSVSSIFEYSEYEIQEGYICTLNESRLKTMEAEEEKLLSEEGYLNINIVFTAEDLAEAELVIDSAKIDLSRLVIEEKASHTSINEFKVYLSQRYLDKYNLGEENIIYEG